MNLCILSTQRFKKNHVSNDMIEALEKAIINEFDNTSIIYISEIVSKINSKVSKRLKKPIVTDHIALFKTKKYSPNMILVIAMGPKHLESYVPLLKKLHCKKAVYCIDTWKSTYERWLFLLNEAKVDTVFLAYKASVPYFRKHIDNVFFLPQSMNSQWFYPRKNRIKKHLFMQMGRKNATLDEWVLRYLDEMGLSDDCYIRELEKGKIIYQSFDKLAEEIGNTYFFVLAPRDFDDSEITGSISDVTARFYEGMACKTLLIGFKPRDTFDELFPSKNAMIEVESYENFKEKVDYYYEHFDEYNKICEDNYNYLIKHHTWKIRAEYLMECLKKII